MRKHEEHVDDVLECSMWRATLINRNKERSGKSISHSCQFRAVLFACADQGKRNTRDHLLPRALVVLLLTRLQLDILCRCELLWFWQPECPIAENAIKQVMKNRPVSHKSAWPQGKACDHVSNRAKKGRTILSMYVLCLCKVV